MDPQRQTSSERGDSAQDKPEKTLPDWLSKWHKMHDKLQGLAPEDPAETAARDKKKAEDVQAAKAEMKAAAKARILAKEAALHGKDPRLVLMETVRDLFNRKAAAERGERPPENAAGKPEATPDAKIVKMLIDKGADVNGADTLPNVPPPPPKDRETLLGFTPPPPPPPKP